MQTIIFEVQFLAAHSRLHVNHVFHKKPTIDSPRSFLWHVVFLRAGALVVSLHFWGGMPRACRKQIGGTWCKRAILTKFQAPKLENSEPERMQFHTPSHSIAPHKTPS